MLQEIDTDKHEPAGQAPPHALTHKEAVIIYKAAHLAHMRKRSTMPDIELIGIAKNSPIQFKTTNGLTGAIIKYVTYVGGFANRISSAGRKIKTKSDKEIYISGTTRRGTPDIDVVFNGLAIKIEVKNKATKDRVSPEQKKVQLQLEAAGAIYFIAETFEGFLSWFIAEIQSKQTVTYPPAAHPSGADHLFTHATNFQ